MWLKNEIIVKNWNAFEITTSTAVKITEICLKRRDAYAHIHINEPEYVYLSIEKKASALVESQITDDCIKCHKQSQNIVFSKRIHKIRPFLQLEFAMNVSFNWIAHFFVFIFTRNVLVL